MLLLILFLLQRAAAASLHNNLRSNSLDDDELYSSPALVETAAAENTKSEMEVVDPFTIIMISSGLIYLFSAMINAGVKRWYAGKWKRHKIINAAKIKDVQEQSCASFADIYTRLRFQHFAIERIAIFLILRNLEEGHQFTTHTPLNADTVKLLPKPVYNRFKPFILSMMALERSQNSLYQVFGDGTSLCPIFVPHPRSHFVLNAYPNALTALMSDAKATDIVYETDVLLFSETAEIDVSETEKQLLSRLMGTIEEAPHSRYPSGLVFTELFDDTRVGWVEGWMTINLDDDTHEMHIDVFTKTGSILGRDPPVHTINVPTVGAVISIEDDVFPSLTTYLKEKHFSLNVHCLSLQFDDIQSKETQNIKLCTRTTRARSHWHQFFKAQVECNNLGAKQKCFWGSRGDEETTKVIKKRIDAFAQLPPAQRAMQGFIVMNCLAASSTPASKSKATCKIERTRAKKISHSGVLWKLGKSKREAKRYFAVVESDTLAWYNTIEERRGDVGPLPNNHLLVKDIVLNDLKMYKADQILIPDELTSMAAAQGEYKTTGNPDSSLSNFQESFVDWVRKDEAKEAIKMMRRREDVIWMDQNELPVLETEPDLLPSCFQLGSITPSGKYEISVFCAATKEEAELWLTALRYVARSYHGVPPLRRDRKGQSQETSMRHAASKLGPMSGLGMKRSWGYRNFVMTDTRLVIVEKTKEKTITWSHSYADMSDVTMNDLQHIPTKGGGKRMPVEMSRALKSSPTSMCLSFLVSSVTKKAQVICSENSDMLEMWHVLLNERFHYFSNEKFTHLEPAWRPMFHNNVLDKPLFSQIIDNIIKVALPKATFWSERALRCRATCRCSIYATRYPIPDISLRPEGQVRFVLRDCPQSFPRVQLDSVEFWPMDSLEVDVDDERINGESEEIDAQQASSMTRPLFELRFRNQYDVSIPLERKVGALDLLLSQQRANKQQAEQDPWTTHLPGEGGQATNGACDYLRLLDVVSQIFSFMRARDGIDISNEWIIPQTEDAIEYLLLQPHAKLLKHATIDRLLRMKQPNKFRQKWGPFFQNCSPLDLRNALDTAKERHLHIELYFHRTDRDEGVLSSFGLPPGKTKYNFKFHTKEAEKITTNVVLRRVWESQLLRGCSSNQIWHPLDEKCVQFCRPLGVAGFLKSSLGRSCSYTLQKRPGDALCDQDLAVPPAKCNLLCEALFHMHPSCKFSDPSSLPAIRADFLVQSEKAIGSTYFSQIKFVAWDVPRAVSPAAVVAFQATPHWLGQNAALSEAVAKLLGYSSTLAGTGGTALGITSAMGGTVVSLVFAGLEIAALVETITSFRKEDLNMQRSMQEKLTLFEHAKCRVINAMSYGTMSSMIPDENGRTHADQIMETVIAALEDGSAKSHDRATTPQDLDHFLDSICNYGQTGFEDEEAQFPSGLSFDECRKEIKSVRQSANELHVKHGGSIIKRSKHLSTTLMKDITANILESSDVNLEAMQEGCIELFPPVSSGSPGETKPPFTSLHFAYMLRDGSSPSHREDWLEWVATQNVATRRKFEAIERITTPKNKQKSQIDIKMGVAAKGVDTILLGERTGGGLPITKIEIFEIPQSPAWNAYASLSSPSKFEYELQVRSTQASLTPVGLLPSLQRATAENLLQNDQSKRMTDICESEDEQCNQFAKTFGGATFLDAVRAGGHVDVNYACTNNWGVGRQESLVPGFAQEKQIFLGYGSDTGNPPIVDLKLSKDPADSILFSLGYYRLDKDMNQQCQFGFQRTKSYTYYKRDWHLRLSYSEIMVRSLKIVARADSCSSLKTKRIVPRSTGGKMIQMIHCDLCMDDAPSKDPTSEESSVESDDSDVESDDSSARSSADRDVMSKNKGLGRIIWKETLPPSKLDGYSRQRVTTFLGEVVNIDPNSCVAQGIGTLTVESHILKPPSNPSNPYPSTLKRSQSMPLLLHNTPPHQKISGRDGDSDSDSDNQEILLPPPVETHGNAGILNWLMELPVRFVVNPVLRIIHGDVPIPMLLETSSRLTLNWEVDTSEEALSEDFSFRGVVHQYSDADLYTYRPDASSKTPWRIMCSEWLARHNAMTSLKRENQSPLTYARRLNDCLLKNDDGEYADLTSTCRKGLVECILGGYFLVEKNEWIPDDGPGLVGGPPVGRVSDYLRSSMCNDDAIYVSGSAQAFFAKIFYRINAETKEREELKFDMLENFGQDETEQALDDALRQHKCPIEEMTLQPGTNKKHQRKYFESRPVPDGYGVRVSKMKTPGLAEVGPESISVRIDRRGQFRKGLQINLGAVYQGSRISENDDYDYKRLAWGITELDTLTLGTFVSSARLGHHKDYKRSVYSTKEAWAYEGFFARVNPGNVPKLRIWPGKGSIGIQVLPAWLGRVRDKKLRLVYSGQIGLMYPHGMGTFTDWTKGSTFRGIIKKEYDTFAGGYRKRRQVKDLSEKYQEVLQYFSTEKQQLLKDYGCDNWAGFETANQKGTLRMLLNMGDDATSLTEEDLRRLGGSISPIYIPVLAGILSRIDVDKIITDDQVIGQQNSLDKTSLPSALLELEEMYFTGRPFPPNTEDQQDVSSGTPSIECRSRAVLAYDQFMDKYSNIINVWLALSKGSVRESLIYSGTLDVQGSGTIDDLLVMGMDANKLVIRHAKQAMHLRTFLNELNQGKDGVFADDVMYHTLSILSLASASGGLFDASDLYWRRVATRLTAKHAEDASVTKKEFADGAACDTDLCMSTLQAVTYIGPLGPLRYAGFNALTDFIHALDELLSFASEMVCLRCHLPGRTTSASMATSEIEMFKKLPAPSDLSTIAKDHAGAYPRLTVGVTRARGIPSMSGTLRVKIALRDQQGRALDTLSTDKVSTKKSAWEDALLIFGAHRNLKADMSIKVEVISFTYGGLKNTVMGTFESKLIGLISKHRRGSNWFELALTDKGREAYTSLQEIDSSGIDGGHLVPAIELNIIIANIGALVRSFPQKIFPLGCGMPSAIGALIRGLEDELPALDRQLTLNDEAINCVGSAALSNDYSPRDCTPPRSDTVRLDTRLRETENSTPRIPAEGSLRNLIFGGIWNLDGNSVVAYEDVETDEEETTFYKGPRYFDEMIAASL